MADDSSTTTCTLNIRGSDGTTWKAEGVDLTRSVGEFKASIASLVNTPQERQRLIYKGKILSDGSVLKELGIEPGHTLHLVKSLGTRTGETPSPTGGASTTAPSPAATTGAGGGMFRGMSGMGGMFGSPFGGAFNMGGSGFPPNLSAEDLNRIMQNPLTQTMISDPAFIRTVVQTNPQLQAMMRANPQMEAVLNDPDTLRQMMQLATNPALMQEAMRGNDRAMANLESMPGGHQALRRLFEQELDPAFRAAADATAAEMPQQQQTQSTSSTQGGPMPNPWASPPPQQQQQQQSPFGGGGGGGGMPLLPGFANLFRNVHGGSASPLPGMGGFPSLSAFNLPGITTPFTSEYYERARRPENLAAMIQMHEATEQLRRDNLLPPLFLLPIPPLATLNSPEFRNGTMSVPSQQPSAARTDGSGGVSATVDVRSDEERFANELTQLEGMGFTDRVRNLRALVATNGNVNAAVERLLGN